MEGSGKRCRESLDEGSSKNARLAGDCDGDSIQSHFTGAAPGGGVSFGCSTRQGMRSRMEDRLTAAPNLISVPAMVAVAPRCRTAGAQPVSTPSFRQAAGGNVQHSSSATEPLHFFAVYDGHNGEQAAELCAQSLHSNFAAALLKLYSAACGPLAHQAEPPAAAGACTAAAANATAADGAGSVCAGMLRQAAAAACGPAAEEVEEAEEAAGSAGPPPSAVAPMQPAAAQQPDPVEQALAAAFLATDREFVADEESDHIGTTAVAAVLSSSTLWLANVGDSRAIVCRASGPVPATSDHTASRKDEVARIVAGGGRIRFGGMVLGALPMTRSIGDQRLRPHVIPEPEVSILARRPGQDQLLVVATDGLWGVMDNARVCQVALSALEEAEAAGWPGTAAAQHVSDTLLEAAFRAHTRDNVSVVVVDLRQAQGVQLEEVGAGAAAAVAGGGSDGTGQEACQKEQSRSSGAEG